MAASNNTNKTFVHDELVAALKEQSFGIQDFKVVSWNSQEASAHVTTLEGNKAVVSLTNAGFKVRVFSMCFSLVFSDEMRLVPR